MWRERAGENKFEAIWREISRFKVFISVTFTSNKMCFVFSVVNMNTIKERKVQFTSKKCRHSICMTIPSHQDLIFPMGSSLAWEGRERMRTWLSNHTHTSPWCDFCRWHNCRQQCLYKVKKVFQMKESYTALHNSAQARNNIQNCNYVSILTPCPQSHSIPLQKERKFPIRNCHEPFKTPKGRKNDYLGV